MLERASLAVLKASTVFFALRELLRDYPDSNGLRLDMQD